MQRDRVAVFKIRALCLFCLGLDAVNLLLLGALLPEGAIVVDSNGNEVMLPAGSELRVGLSRKGLADLTILASNIHTMVFNAYPPVE